MSSFEPGLQLRLSRVLRQMAAQHRHLGPIRQVLEQAIEEGRVRDTLSAFENFQDAVEAHFSLENEFFFPALHGLHPEFARDLEHLISEHARFLEDVKAIGKLLVEEMFESGGAALEALREALAEHEKREESLVAELRSSTQT